MGDGPPGFGLGFTCPALLGIPLGFGNVSRTGLSPPVAGFSKPFRCVAFLPCRGPATPGSKLPGLGSCAFARHYLRNSELISFPRGTEMFHFPRCNPGGLCVQPPVTGSSPAGLLHSEIPGSQCVCHSPELIAAYRVLHRLAVPRHPPCALLRLIVILKSFRGPVRTDPVLRFRTTFSVQFLELSFDLNQSLRFSKNMKSSCGNRLFSAPWTGTMVGVTGVGPVTSSLSGTRSNQLSYTPVSFPRGAEGEVRQRKFVREVRLNFGRRVRQAGRAMCRRVGPCGRCDELTIGNFLRSPVSLERR